MTTTRRRLLAQGLCLPLLLSPADPARAAPARPRRLWGGLRSPVGMAYDAQGALFIAEWSAGRVRKFTPNGQATTFAEGLSGPSGLAIAPDGTIYVASYSDDLIWRFTPEGTKEVHTRGLATPAGLSFDRAGRLMVANRRTNQILRIEGDRKTAIISDLNTPVGVVQTTDGGYVVSNIAGGVTVLRPDGQRIEAGQDFANSGSRCRHDQRGPGFCRRLRRHHGARDRP